MLGKASELGCNGGDVACMCNNPNFGNGVHDCALESCGDIALANIVIGWGNVLCSGAGVNANIPTAGAVSIPPICNRSKRSALILCPQGPGNDATASPVTNTEAASPTTDGSAAETTNSDAANSEEATAITTSAWTSVITGDGVTSTVTGESTIFGIGGVPIASTTLSDAANTSSESEEATAITTSAWTSVITGDGVTSTVTGESTIFGIGGVPIASTTLSATTSPIVSTHTDETTTFETTVGTSTFVPNQPTDDGQGGEGNQSEGLVCFPNANFSGTPLTQFHRPLKRPRLPFSASWPLPALPLSSFKSSPACRTGQIF
jgi:hypothetical protein